MNNEALVEWVPEVVAEAGQGYAVLQACKEEIVHLLALGDTLMMGIAKKVDEIGEKALFRFDINPDTDRPYRSMKEYLPHLIGEMRERARLHKLSKRQVQEYIALYKVFVKGLGLTEQEIMQIGPTHFTEIREALDYDRETGVPKTDEEAREGKIGAETALAHIETLRESNGEVRVQDLRAALDADRGVQRAYLRARWAKVGESIWIASMEYVRGDRVVSVVGDDTWATLSEDEAREVDSMLRLVSNLDEVL